MLNSETLKRMSDAELSRKIAELERNVYLGVDDSLLCALHHALCERRRRADKEKQHG